MWCLHIELDDWCTTVCRMTRSKVKVTSAWKPPKSNRPSVPHVTSFFILFVYEISRGTAERICAKFTRNTCLVPRSDKFEGQSHQGQKTAFSALSAACMRFMFGNTSLASTVIARSALRKVLFLAPSVCVFFCVWNISGTAERICAKFTRKTCLVRRSDEFEGQGHQGQNPPFLGPFGGLHI